MEVSVIIPTYNSSQFLREAVQSVLQQTFADFEIIVIDDGSTDNTAEMMQQFEGKVIYIYQKNQGVSAARNNGIKASKGKYVAFLDSDDVWLPTKLEKQIKAIHQNPTKKVCYTEYFSVSQEMRPKDLRRIRSENYVLQDLLLLGNVVGPPSAVIAERDIFDQIGDFDESLSLSADWDMWIRMACATEFVFLNEPLIKYRLHNSNMSKNVKLLEEDTIRLLEKSFCTGKLPNEILIKRNAAFGYHYIVFAKSYLRFHHFLDFLRCVVRSVSFDIKQIGHLIKPVKTVGNISSALGKL